MSDVNNALFVGWKPGSGSTNTMRVFYAVDPKGQELLAPITGISSVPSFEVLDRQKNESSDSILVPHETGSDPKFY